MHNKRSMPGIYKPYIIAVIYIFVCLCIPMTACHNHADTPHKTQCSGHTQGTYYRVSYYDSLNTNYQEQIDSLLNLYEDAVSPFRKHSLISRINQNKTTSVNSAIFSDIFHKARQIYKETDGAFDPTLAPLINAWGFGPQKNHPDSGNINIDSLLAFTGMDKICLTNHHITKDDKRVQLTFSGIAKGYSVDMIADFLKSKGISSYLVDIGGEVRVAGVKADSTCWKVGIEKPAQHIHDPRKVTLSLCLHDEAIATSGNYRNFYIRDGKKYGHTIDPASGHPADNKLLSASVKTKDCMTADAYATALMVMGKEKAIAFLEKKNMEGFLIFSDSLEAVDTYETEHFRQ